MDQGDKPRDVCIAICYFSSAHSRYASQGESPYLQLYEDIMRSASMWDILLVRDFNACTGRERSACYICKWAHVARVCREDMRAEEVGPRYRGYYISLH